MKGRRVKEGETAVGGLRAKLESVWQYQSHRSGGEKLLTGAHRALIDCELCCGAQPITRTLRDFSEFEHLHAVCRPIRETTQGRGEWERQRENRENKRTWQEGGVKGRIASASSASLFNPYDLDFCVIDFGIRLMSPVNSETWVYISL